MKKKKNKKIILFISRMKKKPLLFVKINKQHLRCKLSYAMTQLL